LGGGYTGESPWKRAYQRCTCGSSFLGLPSETYGTWLDKLAELEPGVYAGDYNFAYPVGVNL
jgi:hypothetical protein